MNIVIVEAPAAPPVSLEELYLFLSLDPEGSPPTHPRDAELTSFLEAATAKVEAATNRALVQQTIRLILPSFDGALMPNGRRDSGIELPRSPFIEIVSVKYLDAAGTEQTLDPSAYTVSALALVPKLYPVGSWPGTVSREDAVRIEYVAGYEPVDSSDLTGNIPAGLKSAVKFEVQLQFDPLSPERRTAIEATVARLLGQYRVHSF